MLSYIQLLLFLLLWLPASEQENLQRYEDGVRFFRADFTGKPVKLTHNVLALYQGNELDYWIHQSALVAHNDSGKISVLHLGDSHIQADYFSGRLRELLQYSFGNGGRGLVFPYRAAKTNNPDNYKVYWTGEWNNCKNVQYSRECELGIAGISITTADSQAGFVIYPALVNNNRYDFTQVKLFSMRTGAIEMLLRNDTADMGLYRSQELDSTSTLLQFSGYRDRFVMRLRPTDTLQKSFTFYGMSLENDSSGLLYHAAGINGAEYFSWNRCRLLQQHIRHLNPHLIILSLGTNEGFNKHYSDESFRQNVRQLIDLIRQEYPQVSIVITLPGESLYRRRTIIQKHVLIRKVLTEVAQEKGCAVWNMYAVMGGKGCMRRWYSRGLTQRDMVHYKAAGYRLQGELLYTALMNHYFSKLK